MVMVEGENALHHVKRKGKMSPGGEMSRGICSREMSRSQSAVFRQSWLQYATSFVLKHS